jgi:2-polyprenyl-3-methyl-5-hydroxy-6-metoxy-1,4-benzoquinol methylase
MASMKNRDNTPEMLDDPDVRPDDLLSSLNFMRQTNELFGGRRAVLEWLERQDPPGDFSLLDIGCGGGDIPFAVAQWAKARSKRARITAIDLQPLCLAYAEKNHPSPDLKYLKHSAFKIEELGEFDYIVSSMFFHHLKDEEIVPLLKKMGRLARRGWLVNDLYRGALNFLGAWLLGLFSFKAIVINDATLSVKRAFRPEDFERYGHETGLPGFKARRRPVFRIVMSGRGTHEHRPD